LLSGHWGYFAIRREFVDDARQDFRQTCGQHVRRNASLSGEILDFAAAKRVMNGVAGDWLVFACANPR